MKKCTRTHYWLMIHWHLTPGLQFTAERLRATVFRTRGYNPAQNVSRWKLKNGEEILFRPIRPDDEPLMVKVHKTLSERSVYLRSFHMENQSARVADDRLIRKCFIDYRQEMALVADRSVPETGQHEILAVGRLSQTPGGGEAEVAVLVSDRYRRHGLGSELVRRLIQVARDEKLQKIIAIILPENLGMRALANCFGFKIRSSDDPAMLTAVLDLSGGALTKSHAA